MQKANANEFSSWFKKRYGFVLTEEQAQEVIDSAVVEEKYEEKSPEEKSKAILARELVNEIYNSNSNVSVGPILEAMKVIEMREANKYRRIRIGAGMFPGYLSSVMSSVLERGPKVTGCPSCRGRVVVGEEE